MAKQKFLDDKGLETLVSNVKTYVNNAIEDIKVDGLTASSDSDTVRLQAEKSAFEMTNGNIVFNISSKNAFTFFAEPTGDSFKISFKDSSDGRSKVIEHISVSSSEYTPTINGDLTTKKYVDSAIASGGGSPYIINGTGTNAIVQKTDPKYTVVDVKSKNPNAYALDNSLDNTDIGAEGQYSSSFGGNTAALGKRAMAQGTSTVAKGAYSHAEGDNCVTLAADSHAEGYATVTAAGALGSHSEGQSTRVLNSKYTIPSGTGSGSGQGGAGAGQGDTWDIDANRGVGSHSEGVNTISSGYASHSEGGGTVADGHLSHAEGEGSIATGRASYAGGYMNTANGDYSFVTGQENKVDGASSAAFGLKNTITGSYSATFGNLNSVAGDYSASVGRVNYIFANESFAVGESNRIENKYFYSFATGKGNNVNASAAFAAGSENLVQANNGMALGKALQITHTEGAVAVGRYNERITSNEPLFVVGNGTSDTKRSNALEVRENGDVYITGNLYCGADFPQVLTTDSDEIRMFRHVIGIVSNNAEISGSFEFVSKSNIVCNSVANLRTALNVGTQSGATMRLFGSTQKYESCTLEITSSSCKLYKYDRSTDLATSADVTACVDAVFNA